MYTPHACILGGIIAVVCAFSFFRGTLWDDFQYHPILASIALYACLPLSVYWHSKAKSSLNATRSLYMRNHALSSGAAAVLILLSLSAVVNHKLQMNKSHLTSWHSWFGLCFFLSFVFQSVSGIANYFGWHIPGATRAQLWRGHRVTFKAILVVWTLTVCTAILSSHFVKAMMPHAGIRVGVCLGHVGVVLLLYKSKDGTTTPSVSTSPPPPAPAEVC